MKWTIHIVFCAWLFLNGGCQSAINKATREAKYSAYEMVGVQKRDLFKKEVTNVKEGQEEAGEAFEDALERLKAIYTFEGGRLERQYRSLNSSFENANRKAEEVQQSITQLETVAQDLFTEWQKEISEISSGDLRAKSASTLAETQKKYRVFYGTLKKSEGKMNHVLARFKDQVLFLKHNLNAQAIVGLKAESTRIEGDIETLINDMNVSIKQAEDFINTM